MKKIENGGVEVILVEEFDLYGNVKKWDVVEEVAVRGVDEPHGIFLGGDDGLVVGLDVVELLDDELAVEARELVMVGEGEVGYRAVAL